MKLFLTLYRIYNMRKPTNRYLSEDIKKGKMVESHGETKKKIIVIIPCYNEEDGIVRVIAAFPRDKLAASGFTLEIRCREAPAATSYFSWICNRDGDDHKNGAAWREG